MVLWSLLLAALCAVPMIGRATAEVLRMLAAGSLKEVMAEIGERFGAATGATVAEILREITARPEYAWRCSRAATPVHSIWRSSYCRLTASGSCPVSDLLRWACQYSRHDIAAGHNSIILPSSSRDRSVRTSN